MLVRRMMVVVVMLLMMMLMVVVMGADVGASEAPPVSVWSQGDTVSVGETATLRCSVSENPDSAPMQWASPQRQTLYFQNTKALKDPRVSLILWNGSSLELSVANVSLSDDGLYTCTYFGHGNPTSSARVSVNAPPTPPTISGDTGPIREGDSASLLCSTNHSKPAAQVTWYRDGLPLNGSLVVTRDPGDPGDPATFSVTSSVTLDPDRRDEAAMLECRVTHPALGSRVATAAHALSIQFPPRVLHRTREVVTVAGDRVSLSCETEGNPRAQVSWSRGNLSVSGVVGQGDGSLSLVSVSVGDSGDYRCLASNALGSDSGIVKLLVIEPTTLKTSSPSAASPNNTGDVWDPASPRDGASDDDSALIAGVVAVVVFVLLCLLVLLGRHLAAGRKGTYVTHEGRRGAEFPESENLTAERDGDADAREYMM